MAFVWICCYDNGASDWKDSYRCRAYSRKSFKTYKEAETAGKAHTNKTGHRVWVKDIGRKRWNNKNSSK